MNNCPNATRVHSTEEKKKTVLDSCKASKASGGGLNSMADSIRSSAHLNMTIGDNSYVAIADTGATHSAIDRHTVEFLRAAGFLIATRTLLRPMDLSLAILEAEKRRKHFSVTDVTSIKIVLQLAAGPLAIRNVQTAVVEQPMPFILLDEPDLLKMGFDATRHLGSVRATNHGSDFSTAKKFLPEAKRYQPSQELQ
jgi:hypothetical protein